MNITTKRLQLAAAISVLAIVATPAAGHEAPAALADTCPHGVHSVADYRVYARGVYKRDKVRLAAHLRLRYIQSCQHSPWAYREVGRLHKRFKTQRAARKRAARRAASCTPYGKWAIPAYIVMRESGGSRTARNATSTAGGYYQFIDSTWYAYGGTRYNDSHPAAVAPAAEQHCVAHRAWAGGSGSGHWALTR